MIDELYIPSDEVRTKFNANPNWWGIMASAFINALAY